MDDTTDSTFHRLFSSLTFASPPPHLHLTSNLTSPFRQSHLDIFCTITPFPRLRSLYRLSRYQRSASSSHPNHPSSAEELFLSIIIHSSSQNNQQVAPPPDSSLRISCLEVISPFSLSAPYTSVRRRSWPRLKSPWIPSDIGHLS
jgi:hypothetical protein